MDAIQTRNRRYEGITWGALFLWAGVRDLIPGLPNGTGLVGVGIILLGVNLARRLTGISINAVTAALGAMAVSMGGVVLYSSLAGIRLDLPFFPVLLVVIGVAILARAATCPGCTAQPRN